MSVVSIYNTHMHTSVWFYMDLFAFDTYICWAFMYFIFFFVTINMSFFISSLIYCTENKKIRWHYMYIIILYTCIYIFIYIVNYSIDRIKKIILYYVYVFLMFILMGIFFSTGMYTYMCFQ